MSAVLAELPVAPQVYACDIVSGVEANSERVDEVIGRHAIDWTLDRMPAVDRALLRIATFELGWRTDVPTSVVISEAVELAKGYSTDESGGFVNGMLANVARELRPGEVGTEGGRRPDGARAPGHAPGDEVAPGGGAPPRARAGAPRQRRGAPPPPGKLEAQP